MTASGLPGMGNGKLMSDLRASLARELHDGLAQELVYIASRVGQLERTGADASVATQIQAAAQRALFEVRCVIEQFRAQDDDPPLGLLTERAAASYRARFGVAVELDVVDELDVDPARRSAVLRILGEAIANSVSHGGASHVNVRLRRHGQGVLLRVDDDGCGFDAACAASGWGLTGMRERAEQLDGCLSVASSPGGGVVVEAVLP